MKEKKIIILESIGVMLKVIPLAIPKPCFQFSIFIFFFLEDKQRLKITIELLIYNIHVWNKLMKQSVLNVLVGKGSNMLI